MLFPWMTIAIVLVNTSPYYVQGVTLNIREFIDPPTTLEDTSCSLVAKECGNGTARNCANCGRCWSLSVRKMPQSSQAGCYIYLHNYIREVCSLETPTYYEFKIRKREFAADDCFSLLEFVSSRTICPHSQFSSSGSTLNIMRSFDTRCNKVGAFQFYTVGSEFILGFEQKSNTGVEKLYEDVLEFREILYRIPIGNSNPECTCPEGFVKHKCTCYALFTNVEPPKPWVEAEKDCVRLGGHLLSIADADEMTDMKHFIRSVWWKKIFTSEILLWFYIGLRDEDSRNSMPGRDMRWTDSNPATYTEWYHPGFADWVPDVPGLFIKDQLQPSGITTSECTAMFINYEHMFESSNWVKIPCNFPLPLSSYICKKPGNSILNVTNPPNSNNFPERSTKDSANENKEKSVTLLQNSVSNTSGTVIRKCQDGWTYVGDMCYQMITDTRDLDTGPVVPLEDFCSRINSTVAVFDSDDIVLSKLLNLWKHTVPYGKVKVKRSDGTFIDVDVKEDYKEKEDLGYRERFYLDMNLQAGSVKYQGYTPVIPQEATNVICQNDAGEETVVCGFNQFKCDDGSCILSSYVCDRKVDCLNGADERVCHSDWFNLFKCKDGGVVSYSSVCDYVSDCADNSDELGCTSPPCKNNEFRCKNGQCIEAKGKCDFVRQCFDGTDEVDCHECSGFQCFSGKCVPKVQKQDIYVDCPGISSEDEASTAKDIFRGILQVIYPYGLQMMPAYESYCPEPDQVRCRFTHPRCFPRHQVCIAADDEHGNSRACRDGRHLLDCVDFQCPGMFKCRNTYCIPSSKLCDGRWDCPGGEDEVDCMALGLPGYFRCRGTKNLYHQSEICDGIIQCPNYADDERLCTGRLCPDRCLCSGFSVMCRNSGIRDLDWASKTLRALNLSGNDVKVTNQTFEAFYWLAVLDISNNSIQNLPANALQDLGNLLHLDLRHNDVKQLVKRTFSGLVRLKTLRLQGNAIAHISPDAFLDLNSVSRLDLSVQALHILESGTFLGLTSLKDLTLVGNHIAEIHPGAFSGLSNLSKLDLRQNDIGIIIEDFVFEPLQLDILQADEYRICCAANFIPLDGPHAKECTPMAGRFSSCSDLMARRPLQIAVWVLGITSVLGNLFVLVWRMTRLKTGGVDNVLVLNLSFADILMGIYLLIIATADVIYRDVYVIYDPTWRSSAICTLAGILSFVSSEMSVFSLVFITVDRVIAIVLAFRFDRLRTKKVLVILSIAWLVILACALAPISKAGILRMFYGRNSVCLPFTFDTEQEIYSSVFLVINLVGFVIITAGYVSIYYVIDKSRKRFAKLGKNSNNEREMAFLKKMSLVILTDFCCWVPIIVINFVTFGGIAIHPEAATWIAVFVLPLNSAINPILYTISVVSKKRNQARSKQRNIASNASCSSTHSTTL